MRQDQNHPLYYFVKEDQNVTVNELQQALKRVETTVQNVTNGFCFEYATPSSIQAARWDVLGHGDTLMASVLEKLAIKLEAGDRRLDPTGKKQLLISVKPAF